MNVSRCVFSAETHKVRDDVYVCQCFSDCKTHKRNKSRFFPSSLHMSDPCFSVETKHTYCDMFEVLSSTGC
jgi:hypothetical protein